MDDLDKDGAAAGGLLCRVSTEVTYSHLVFLLECFEGHDVNAFNPVGHVL